MAKTLEKETVAAIEQAILTAQKTGRQPDLHGIAAIFATTYHSVCYIKRRIERLQRTGVDDRKKPGRKPMPEREQIAFAILDLLTRRPDLDQAAVSDFVFDEFGKRISQTSISRIYKNHGIPHKISNKLYKKSKLFTTHPNGQIMTVDNSRELAASALSSLPTKFVVSFPKPPSQASLAQTYKSPYAPVLPTNMMINGVPPNSPSANLAFDSKCFRVIY
jgi:transposase